MPKTPLPDFSDDAVKAFFGSVDGAKLWGLIELRNLIFQIAEEENVGLLQETLKWGQPAYLTPTTKSGTTIRIDSDDAFGGHIALYVNCKTTLVDEWRDRFPEMTFGGTRSVHFRLDEDLSADRVKTCIAMALNYHRAKRR